MKRTARGSIAGCGCSPTSQGEGFIALLLALNVFLILMAYTS